MNRAPSPSLRLACGKIVTHEGHKGSEDSHRPRILAGSSPRNKVGRGSEAPWGRHAGCAWRGHDPRKGQRKVEDMVQLGLS